jgi:hypothetical protein
LWFVDRDGQRSKNPVNMQMCLPSYRSSPRFGFSVETAQLTSWHTSVTQFSWKLTFSNSEYRYLIYLPRKVRISWLLHLSPVAKAYRVRHYSTPMPQNAADRTLFFEFSCSGGMLYETLFFQFSRDSLRERKVTQARLESPTNDKFRAKLAIGPRGGWTSIKLIDI